MSNYFLEHYGVVGMRWGKRRSTPLLGDGVEVVGSGRSSRPSGDSRSDQRKRAKNTSYTNVDDSSGSSKSKGSSGSSKSNKSNSNTNDSSRSNSQDNSSSGSKKQKHTTESNETNNNQPKTPKNIDTKGIKDGLGAGKKLAEVGANKLKEDRESRRDDALKKEAKEMTNAEMQEVITRLNMEARYVDVMRKTTAPEAKSNLERTLDVVGQAAGYADTALSVYNTIQDIRRKL